MTQLPRPSVPAIWRISTKWSQVHNPAHFFLRYAEAVRRYLLAWLRDPHAADDVLQKILLQVSEKGFLRADPTKGRFRDYLLVVVRNAARKSQRTRTGPEPMPEELIDPRPDPASQQDHAWLAEWRACLIDRAFRALHAHEVETPGNRYYAVLRLATDNPREDQAILARVLSRDGRQMTHDAFRKTLERSRRFFAEILVKEVAQTLEEPGVEELEEELASLEMLSLVTPFLPKDWREGL